MNYKKELAFTKALALEAGKVAQSMQQVATRHFKSEMDIVTEADLAVEKLIVEAIQNEFPTDRILAEEGFNDTVLNHERTWVIDPIDGTINYDRGIPLYGTSIALVENKQSVMGVIYLPAFAELYFATKDEGAFCNQEPIQVSGTQDIKKSLVHLNGAYNTPIFEGAGQKTDAFMSVSSQVMRSRIIGSAVVESMYVASGRIEAYACDAFFWDFAAGNLIIEEAGGRVSRVDGSPYDPTQKDVVQSNGLIHQELLELLAC